MKDVNEILLEVSCTKNVKVLNKKVWCKINRFLKKEEFIGIIKCINETNPENETVFNLKCGEYSAICCKDSNDTIYIINIAKTEKNISWEYKNKEVVFINEPKLKSTNSWIYRMQVEV